jgi:NhaC family Na+:H+ antiporter
MHPMNERKAVQLKLWQALLPVLFLIVLMGTNVLLYEGSPHIPLLLGAAFASVVAVLSGRQWTDIEEGILHGVTIALKACLILMIIGILIGTWIAGGIVPIMIYYGLELIAPAVFLPLACVVCGVVSLATGSSWSTAGTVGVALIGIAQGLQIPVGLAAGAIISGAYFGDKMSPLSDTTNLAPAVAGSELFEHIRHMVYTTAPAFLISVVLYSIIGYSMRGESGSMEQIVLINETLERSFNLNLILLTPPLLVIAMVVFRLPALPALLAGALIGGIFCMLFQGADLGSVFRVAQEGFVSETGVPAVDDLLSRGGLESMFWTLSLIICAMCFGGVMERAGMLQCIALGILRFARSTGSLITSVIATCITMNVIAPDQYLSIVVPGRMYKSAFEKMDLMEKNLSRSLEDGGTISSPLVPWNTCGAYMAQTLGVATIAYLPYAFFNFLTPLMGILLAYTGWTIRRRSRPTPAT